MLRILSRLFNRWKSDRAAEKPRLSGDGPAPRPGPITRPLEPGPPSADQNGANADQAPTYALLTPRVPLTGGFDPTDSWFGGAPRLPPGMPWPMVDETMGMLFLCQINCANLPADIWGGVGPRTGWLAFFAHPWDPFDPIAFHFDGPCEERQGSGQIPADWHRSARRERPSRGMRPRWPIDITPRTGPEPVARHWRAGYAPGLPDPLATETFDLRRPEFQPFDRQTLDFLLEAIRAHVDRFGKTAADHLRKGSDGTPQGAVNLAFMTEFARLHKGSDTALRSVETAIAAEADPADFSRFIRDLCEIELFSCQKIDRWHVPEGAPEYRLIRHPLYEDPAPGPWWRDYFNGLYDCARYAYSQHPGSLPEATRQRFEKMWAFEVQHEGGAMGHTPYLHYWTPVGPGTPNETLLELRTSTLNGWQWGDMYSLMLIIDREDLRAHRFDRLTFEITN